MKKLLPLLLVFLLFSSCYRVLLLTMEVKSPKIETHQSLIKYLDKYHLNSEQIYAAKDSISMMNLWANGFTEAVIFNKDGFFVDYREEPESCNAGIDAFIEYLPKNQDIEIDQKYHADSLLQQIVLLNDMTSVPFDNSYDYTIVLTWVKFAGKVIPQHFKPWEESIQIAETNGLKIRRVYLNLDFMDYMGYEGDPEITVER
jgi:hypothetical protein